MIRVSISQLIENVQRLNEDKRGNIVRILKLPKWVADWFHEEFGPKYSFAFAQWWKQWNDDERVYHTMASTSGPTDELAERIIDQHLDWFKNQTRIQSLLRFLKDNPEQFRNIKNMGFYRAEVFVGGHYKTLREKESKREIEKNALLKFDDGFFWHDTKSNKCETWISDKMQHCGQDDTGHLQILFDDKLEPHVTLTWNKEDGEVTQLVGKQNRYPEEKYWPHIYDLIVDKDLGISSTVAQGEFGEYIDEREMAANPHVADADDPLDYPEHYQLQENKRNIRLIIS